MAKYLIDELYLIGETDDGRIIYNAVGGIPIDYATCVALRDALAQYMSRGEDEINLLYQRGIQEYLNPDRSYTKRSTSNRSGYVYLVECNFAYKIGIAKNVEQRIQNMQTAAPDEITLLCTISTDDMNGLEKELHTKFKDKRRIGEWFDLSPEDVEYIKGLAQ